MTHIEVLKQARLALQDCLGVMQNELKGLEVIQPEIRVAAAAVAAINSILAEGDRSFWEVLEKLRKL